MLTGLPLLFVWIGPPDEREWSPSGINSFLECQRKWAWKKIAKIEDPGGAGANLGKRAHTMWERYLGEGTRPDFVTDKEAAGVASLTLHLLPAPKTPGMRLEKHFRFKSARTGHVYHGFKDFEIPPGVPQPQLELDGSAPVVGDHKTSKDIEKYGKSVEDLQDDAQSILYGLDAMARHQRPFADLAWIYAQTKGAKKTKPVVGRLHQAQAMKVFDVIEQVATEAAAILDAGLQPLDLPPNTAMCREYGGCPYQHLCKLSPSQKLRSRMSNSVIDGLRARVQGTTPVVVQEKPSIMGCAPEDVPAPTEIPAAFLQDPVRINPGESALPTPPLAAAPAPTEKRKRRTKAEIAADEAAARASNPPATVTLKETGPEIAKLTSEGFTTVEDIEAVIGKGDGTASRTHLDAMGELHVPPVDLDHGFTLYVDCVPIGRPAKSAASLIEKAQERIAKEHGVPDYRLVDYGKGVPFFVAFVDEQVDGTFDLALDTRTPEGAVLLETLAAKASLVVRGFR